MEATPAGFVWRSRPASSRPASVNSRLPQQVLARGRVATAVPAQEVTFATFARQWLVEFGDRRQHRRTTRADYRGIIENHLVPHFGESNLADVTTTAIDAYVAAKRSGSPPLSAQTLNLHLTRLHSIFNEARRQHLVATNPVSDAERPRPAKRRWTILLPAEIAAVMRGFDDLINETGLESERAWRQTAKSMTMTMLYSWLRRGELLGLRWREVDLRPDGPRLHVREAWVRGHRSLPKTEDGVRTITLADALVEELRVHRARSRYPTASDLVFPHPLRGSPIAGGYFGAIARQALMRAHIESPMREYHDWRHTGITNAAASGMDPLAIMTMAGHADFKTTQRYIDLAGVFFGRQVQLLARWYADAGEAAASNRINPLPMKPE